jgi:hypothetical protein
MAKLNSKNWKNEEIKVWLDWLQDLRERNFLGCQMQKKQIDIEGFSNWIEITYQECEECFFVLGFHPLAASLFGYS